MGSIWNSTGQLEVANVGPGSAAVEESRSWVGSVQKTTVATATSLDLLIQVGTVRVVGEFGISAFGEVEVELREDTTFSAAGTAVPFVNRNRDNPSPVPSASLSTGPTITAPGLLLASVYLPGGDKNNAVGLTGDIQGWKLKLSSAYLLRITNTSAAAVEVSANLSLAEIPD